MGLNEKTVDDEGIVRIGSVVFALIKPTPGSAQAFNHWYERDHYYTAGTAAPGVFSAARFVQPDAGLHLALYFVLPGYDAARVEFATEQVRIANDEDRLFVDREHLHTWNYEVATSWRANPTGVPPALALDRRYAGVTVVMVDGPSPDLDTLLAQRDHDIDLVLALQPIASIMESTWAGSADTSRRTTVVAFHGDDSEPARAALAPLRRDNGFNWTGSFVPVVFGTDIHVID